MRLRLIITAAAFAMLSGCTHDVDSAHARSFGRAANLVVTAQTEPVQATEEAPEGSGAVGARAVDRYANAPPPPPAIINLNLNTTN